MPSKNEDSAKKNGGHKNNVDAVLNYKVVVRTDSDALVKLEGTVPMPMFLDPITVHQSEVNFKKIFDALVVDPVKLQVQTKIRKRQKELVEAEEEKNMEQATQMASDVFMLNETPEETPEETTKKEPENNDKPEENSSSDTSEGRKQGDSKQEHSDGEWTAPDPVSG